MFLVRFQAQGSIMSNGEKRDPLVVATLPGEAQRVHPRAPIEAEMKVKTSHSSSEDNLFFHTANCHLNGSERRFNARSSTDRNVTEFSLSSLER